MSTNLKIIKALREFAKTNPPVYSDNTIGFKWTKEATDAIMPLVKEFTNTEVKRVRDAMTKTIDMERNRVAKYQIQVERLKAKVEEPHPTIRKLQDENKRLDEANEVQEDMIASLRNENERLQDQIMGLKDSMSKAFDGDETLIARLTADNKVLQDKNSELVHQIKRQAELITWRRYGAKTETQTNRERDEQNMAQGEKLALINHLVHQAKHLPSAEAQPVVLKSIILAHQAIFDAIKGITYVEPF